MRKITKVLFGFGSIVAVVVPLSATVACDGLKDDHEDEFKVDKSASHALSNNEWTVTLKKDTITKTHLIDVLRDKLWFNYFGSIGNDITIKDKSDNKILSFSILVINNTTYKNYMLWDEIADKLDDSIQDNGAQQYFK